MSDYIMAPGARLYTEGGKLYESTGNYLRGRPTSGPPGPLGACCAPCGRKAYNYGPVATGNGDAGGWGTAVIIIGGGLLAWWLSTKLYK